MNDLTAGTLLEQDGLDLDARLRDHGALGEPAGGRHHHVWDGAYGRLAVLARGFLVTDLAGVLLFGLGKTQELVRAAEHTRYNDQSETVELDGHQFSLEQHPSVDLIVQEQRVRTIEFTLAVDIDVVVLAASVTRARIVELSTGKTDLHVRFSLGELLLGETKRTIDPHVCIDLHDGWNLLPAHPSAEPSAQPSLDATGQR